MKKFNFKKYLIISLIIILVSASIFITSTIINNIVDNGSTYENDILLLESGISSLEKSNSATQSAIDELDITLTESFESDYIELITNIAEEYNLTFSKLQSDGDIQNADMRITTLKFECIGDSASISAFLNIVNKQNCIVKNFCFRQNNNFLWLDRTLDNQAILDWIDLSNASPAISTDEVITISVNDIKDQTNMRCYIEIEFLSKW